MMAVPLLFREGLRKILEPEKDIEIVAEASNQEEIIPLVEQKKPDVLYLDTALSDLDIEKTLESIEEMSPETKVLLLTRTRDEEVMINALSFGVRGYLTATSTQSSLLKQLEQ